MILDNFSHVGYSILFAGLAILVEWFFAFQIIKKYIKRIVLFSLLFGGFYGFIADYFAISNGIWSFDSGKVLGIWILNVPIDELIWGILVGIAIWSALFIFAHYEESKIPFSRWAIYFFRRQDV